MRLSARASFHPSISTKALSSQLSMVRASGLRGCARSAYGVLAVHRYGRYAVFPTNIPRHNQQTRPEEGRSTLRTWNCKSTLKSPPIARVRPPIRRSPKVRRSVHHAPIPMLAMLLLSISPTSPTAACASLHWSVSSVRVCEWE
jgi:hypothetical protein